MKMSLRNFAFVGALALAGAAMAQEAPFTVTENWFHVFDSYAAGSTRYGTGVNGKIYLPVAGTGIDVIDATGKVETITASCTNTANITHDDAGNLLWHASFAGGLADGTTWYIMTPDKEIHTLTFAAPEHDDAVQYTSRQDMFGRVVGDMMSEDGAILALCSNTCKKGYLYCIKNGAPADLPMTDYADFDTPTPLGTFDSTSIGQPRYTFEEICDMADDAYTAFAFRKRGALSPFIYKDGEWVKASTDGGLKSSEGFDTFFINDAEYFVIPMGAVNYTTRFGIFDAEGTCLYQSPEKHELSTAAGQGFGSITANVVEGNKVEIYINGVCNANTAANADLGYPKAPSYAAMYTLDFGGAPTPEPATLYVAGDFQGWNPNEPAEFAYADGVYSYTFPAEVTTSFKMSTAKGDWDAEGGFNSGVVSVAGTIADNTGETKYDLTTNNADSHFDYAEGQWTLYVDLEAKKVWAKNETPKGAPVTLYLRAADLNEWGYNEATTFASEDGVNYTLGGITLAAGSEFKIANASWGKSFGGATNIQPGTEVTLSDDGGACNNTLAVDVKDATFKFNIESRVLVVEVPVVPKRAAFAYGIKVEGKNIAYSLNEDAKEVSAILTNEAGEKTTVALAGVTKGSHNEDIDGVAPGDYSVEIEVVSTVEGTADLVQIYEETEHTVSVVRGGVVVINDPEYDSFGMVAVGHGKAQGIDLYDQAGNYVNRYHAGFAGWVSTNQSSVFRGDDRKGYAAFADWSDKGSGAWAFDPLNPETEPWNIIRPEGCEVQDSGCVLVDGVATAGGTSCASFYGEGEKEVMWFFEEDVPGCANVACAYPIAGQDYLTKPATFISKQVTGGWFANTNVELVQVNDYGYFASQCRDNGSNTPGCPAFAFIPFFEGEDGAIEEGGRADCINGANIFTDEPVLNEDGTEKKDEAGNTVYKQAFPSCAGTIAINPAGDLFAVVEYNGISVATLDWNEYGEPIIERFAHIDLPRNVFADVDFDYANNLHIYFRDLGGYKVFALTGDNTSVTPAKKAEKLSVTSSIKSISADNVANGTTVYYNLNGQRVNADNLTTGVYVRVNGAKAEKVVVK